MENEVLDNNKPSIEDNNEDLSNYKTDSIVIDEDKLLNSEESKQLEIDSKVYMEENNTTIEEAKELCRRNLDEIKKLKKQTDDNNYFEGNNKDFINKCLEKKEYINTDIKSIKETIKNHNIEVIKDISESLNALRDNSLFTNQLSNYKGKSSSEYQIFLEDLQDKIKIVTKNTNTLESIGKMIDEEIEPGIEKLEEYNQKREETRTKLETYKSDYNNFLAIKIEPLINKYYTNKEVTPNVLVPCFVTNTEYIEWLTKKLNYENEINNIVETINNFDKLGLETQTQIYKSIDKEKELGNQIQNFKEISNE